MKYIHTIIFSVLLLSVALSFQSCLDGDDAENQNYPNALVTIKTNPKDGKVFFQLDDKTTIFPVNLLKSPAKGKEVRAITSLRMEEGKVEGYTHKAYVNWIDTILTKQMAPDLGEQNAKTYGNDPIEIVGDWTTIVEDGYLTLRFRTYFGYGVAHRVNLVKSDQPYEVVLHHDAMGDAGLRPGDGLVAFRLNDLPDTEGKTVDLKLKWQSFTGQKSVTFKYCSRKKD